MMSIPQKKVDTSPQPALLCKKLNITETDEAEIKAGNELTESRVCWKAAGNDLLNGPLRA